MPNCNYVVKKGRNCNKGMIQKLASCGFQKQGYKA